MESTNVFDLSELESSKKDTADLSVLHPVTREDTGAVITLHSPDSDEAQKLDSKMADRRLSKMGNRAGMKLTSQELLNMTLERLTGMTKSISGFYQKGVPYESNKNNIYALYKANPWLREQVSDFLEERRNFFTE